MIYKKLEELLDYEQPNNYIVEDTKYDNKYKTPVLTAGQSFILGYTNEESGIFKANSNPVIIFDDFTTSSQYVDFDFKVKSSAMKILKAKDGVNIKYVYYLMQTIKFDNQLHKRYWISTYSKIKVPIPNIEMQNEIVRKLDLITKVVANKQEQLQKLDQLIKSQFVEMFGDPIINDKNINSMKMPDVCEIIDGDRGKNYPKAEEFFEEEYCLFLNAKNVTTNGFSFENCMFITEEKDKKLRNGKLKRGDVVLTTRGTIGNLAFYNEEIPFENVRINSGMVILRMKKDIVNEIFFIEQFKMQLDDIKNKIANGSAQPQLPIIKMNGIKVLSPDIELQNQFADIVKQIDKQKFEIEKSLKEMQELYESLMEKYFG